MTRSIRGRGIAALALTCAVALAGCGQGALQKTGEAASAGGCDPAAKGPGISDSEILLGATMPLSGSGAAGGLGVKRGQEAYYKMINDAGGVQGRKIDVKILDDAYDPSTAQKQMRQLVQNNKIFAVSGGEGTPNFLGVVPFLERESVPAIAPYAPSDELGTMDKPNIFMASVNYVEEFDILTQAVLEKNKVSKISLVGVSGNVGDNAKAGIERAVSGKGIDVDYVAETPGTTDFTPIASQMKSNGADWVFLILTNADTGGLLKAMQRVGYSPRTAAWSGMSDDSYLKEFGSLSEGMLVALETADLASDDPMVAQFRTDFQTQTGKAPTKFDELGWVQAQLTTEALKRAKGLSRPCLVESLEGMKDVQTGILPPVTWGPDDRAGVDAVGIGQIEDSQLKVVQETKSLTS
jgi:branched-chain amino acid transport system substrate-binding protein